MSRFVASEHPVSSLNWRLSAWAIVAAVILVFVMANAHLAFVALLSQPPCALQDGGSDPGEPTYRAASPAC
jgi:hypothetical protein